MPIDDGLEGLTGEVDRKTKKQEISQELICGQKLEEISKDIKGKIQDCLAREYEELKNHANAIIRWSTQLSGVFDSQSVDIDEQNVSFDIVPVYLCRLSWQEYMSDPSSAVLSEQGPAVTVVIKNKDEKVERAYSIDKPVFGEPVEIESIANRKMALYYEDHVIGQHAEEMKSKLFSRKPDWDDEIRYLRTVNKALAVFRSKLKADVDDIMAEIEKHDKK